MFSSRGKDAKLNIVQLRQGNGIDCAYGLMELIERTGAELCASHLARALETWRSPSTALAAVKSGILRVEAKDRTPRSLQRSQEGVCHDVAKRSRQLSQAIVVRDVNLSEVDRITSAQYVPPLNIPCCPEHCGCRAVFL